MPCVMNVVLTSVDLQDVAQGGELVLAPGTLVTSQARDDAAERGILLRVAEARTSPKDAGDALVSVAPLIVAAPVVPVGNSTSADAFIRAVTEEVIAYLSGAP